MFYVLYNITLHDHHEALFWRRSCDVALSLGSNLDAILAEGMPPLIECYGSQGQR